MVSEGEEGNAYLSSTCSSVPQVFKCARMIGRGPQGKRGPKGTSGNSKFYTDTGTLTNKNTRERVDVFQKDVYIL